MESRYKKLGKNTIIVFIGRAGSSLIGMIMLPFYTRWLSPEEYGVSDLLNTYAMVLLGFVSCCISDSIFIYPNQTDKKGKNGYFTSGLLFFLCSLIIAILLIILIQWIDIEKFRESIFIERIWFIFAIMFSQFSINYIQSFSRSINKMKIFSLGGIFQTIAIAGCAFLFIPKWGLNGYLISIVIANFLAAIFIFLFTKSYKYIKIHDYQKKYLKDLLAYGIPLIPNGIMWWLVNGLNRPVMENFLGLGALGIFAVSNKFPSLLSILVSIFNMAWSISVLEEFHKPDFNKFFNRILQGLFFIMVIGGCFLSAFSKLIIKIFASNEFYEAWKFIPVLTIGVVFQNLSGIIGGIFAAEKKSKYFFYSSLWGGMISIGATFFFTKLYGLQGAAIAVALSFFVMALVRLKYAWKYINEINLNYYIIMVILYILFNIIVILDYPLWMNVPLYIIILCFIISINSKIIKYLVEYIYLKLR